MTDQLLMVIYLTQLCPEKWPLMPLYFMERSLSEPWYQREIGYGQVHFILYVRIYVFPHLKYYICISFTIPKGKQEAINLNRTGTYKTLADRKRAKMIYKTLETIKGSVAFKRHKHRHKISYSELYIYIYIDKRLD